MRPIKRIVLLLIVVLLLGLVLTPIVYVQSNKKIFANKVTKYLIEDQKYRMDEIESVKGVWGLALPQFYVVVLFKDEPTVEYIYFAHNDVIQFEYKAIVEEMKKPSKSDLKHYDPY